MCVRVCVCAVTFASDLSSHPENLPQPFMSLSGKLMLERQAKVRSKTWLNSTALANTDNKRVYPPDYQLWGFVLCRGHYFSDFSETLHATVLSLDVLYRAHSGLFRDVSPSPLPLLGL